MNLQKNPLSVRILAAFAIAAFLPASPALAVLPGGIRLYDVYDFTSTVLPAAHLVQGTNGNLYGTTEAVGTNLYGAIFMLTQSGDYTNLVVFNSTNGAVPQGPLFLSTDGNFYGTTAQGGSGNRGTLFRMTHAGVLTTLVKFAGTNGSNPIGGVVLGPHGYYYGTASSGGAGGHGSLFAWGPKIGLSNLFSFGLTNGASPQGGVVADTAGNLYGTTYLGGSAGQGTIFKLTTTNTLTTLVTFQHTNGAFPCGLVAYSNSLFGVTFAGGSNDLGEVFSAKTSGSLTVLASFALTNGSSPKGLLLLGGDGYLYGTTLQGGSSGKGVVFRVSTNSTASSGGKGGSSGGGSATSQAPLTNLAYFTGANGAYPQGGLMLAGDGNIYGITSSGGTDGYGNIFELSGFPPVIYQQPASQNFAAKATNHFTVGTSGSTPLTYQWIMDGATLTNGGNISGATNSQLTIGPAVLANAGSYSVVVANAFGSATSTVATLTIPAPTLTIKSPGKDVSAALLTVQGTASGKYGVTNVQFQFNNGSWSSATTTNQWTNWSAVVTLQAGTNVFQAFSVDPVGNHSSTNSVTVFYVTKSPLTLLVKGFGQINHTFTGTNLIVGTNYTVTASPNANNLFSNWTGTINTTNSPLTFQMVSNMTLTANFVTNSFLRAAGTYNGLFYDVTNGVSRESAGLLGGLTVGKQGVFTGSLYVSGTNYSVSNKFDLEGNASNQISRASGLGPISLTMHLDWNATPPQITGMVQGTNGGAWSAALTNEMAGTGLGSAEYTMLIPPGTNAPADSPGGDGYALITNNAGGLSVTGALADGATFSQHVAESELLHLPFYATPYTNGGLLLGWLDLRGGAPAGSLTWIRPTAASGLYPNGYTNLVTVQSSAWTNPASDTNVILVRVEQLDVSGGFLAAPIDFVVGLDYKNLDLPVQTGGPTNSLSSTITAKTGLLKITFGNGSGTNTTSATGAILQNHALGGGFFTTKTNAGAFTLTPQ
jgi:uncharacterized repeat protein (TIGR03803 family)